MERLSVLILYSMLLKMTMEKFFKKIIKIYDKWKFVDNENVVFSFFLLLAHLSFSEHLLSSVRKGFFYIVYRVFSKTTGPILTKLG